MYMKFQYVDTSNCFHILNSTKPTPSIGISIPPTKKYKEQNKLHDPNGRVEKSKNLGVKFRTGVGYGNDVKKKLDYQIGKSSHNRVLKNGALKTQNVFLRTEREEEVDGQSRLGNGVQTKCSTKCCNEVKETPVDKSESEEKIDGKSSSANVVQTNRSKKWCNDVKETKNGVLKIQNGVLRKPVDRTESKKKVGQLSSGNAMEKVQTKCSKKWARYGGCIPVMLEALEKVSNLDEALKPWEKSLTKKERTIILKEQVEWQRAMEIFEWFKKRGCHELNVIHYNIVLRILGKSQRWGEIEKLWGEMKEKRIEPINSTYGTLIDVYSKGGRREQAMEWLKLMNERLE